MQPKGWNQPLLAVLKRILPNGQSINGLILYNVHTHTHKCQEPTGGEVCKLYQTECSEAVQPVTWPYKMKNLDLILLLFTTIIIGI